MAIEQMEGMNIRRMIVPIRQFIRDNDQPDFAKSLLIELMIDQEIDEDLEVVKKVCTTILTQVMPQWS